MSSFLLLLAFLIASGKLPTNQELMATILKTFLWQEEAELIERYFRIQIVYVPSLILTLDFCLLLLLFEQADEHKTPISMPQLQRSETKTFQIPVGGIMLVRIKNLTFEQLLRQLLMLSTAHLPDSTRKFAHTEHYLA